ncbi:hypothetical protein Tco_0241839, partial [Tanacetum coccineum]
VIQPVITVVTAAEDVIPLQPRRPKKIKTTVSDAGGSSHPPKKLMEDHETLSEASVGGKSKYVVQQLLVGAVQNVVVRGEPIPTLPFVTSTISATPERKEEDHTDSLAGANLHTIRAPQRFIISSDSSHHSGANIAEAEADSFIRPSVPLMTMTTTVTSTVDPTTTPTSSDFIVGGIRTVVSPDTDIQKGKKKIECHIKVADLAATVKVREQEVADLDAMVTSVNFIMTILLTREMNKKFNKLDTDLVELALHLEERFYPHLLTTISGRRWLLTHGLELAIAKCLNSTEYLSSLGAAIGNAVKKGMQEGLSAGITHGAAGRVLTDVAVYNPSAKADYLSALQLLQSVNFSLIVELKSNKDASIDTLMNLIHLEDSLAERLNLVESQPHVDQLMNRVRRIRENIANDRSALHDVFVPLAEPLSIAALEGTAGTSSSAPGTTTALSVTFASTSSIPPISIDDYEVVHTDGQEGTDADGQTSTGANANPFPSIDDAELNVPE